MHILFAFSESKTHVSASLIFAYCFNFPEILFDLRFFTSIYAIFSLSSSLTSDTDTHFKTCNQISFHKSSYFSADYKINLILLMYILIQKSVEDM